MEHAKYIMVKYGDEELPFIFSAQLDHSEVAERLKAEHNPMLGPMTVVSAGFVDIKAPLQCYGKSHTLNVSCQQGDSEWASACLYARLSEFEIGMEEQNTKLRAEVERLNDLIDQEGE